MEENNTQNNEILEQIATCLNCTNPATESSNSTQEQNYKEKFMRTLADFENFKQRVEKEKTLWCKDSQAEMAKKFLPLIDDVDRAASAVPNIENTQLTQTWIDGVIKICSNNQQLLKKLGIEEIACAGEFDPELHEALCQVPALDSNTASGHIVQVLRKGYTFNGIVLRHAQVSVTE